MTSSAEASPETGNQEFGFPREIGTKSTHSTEDRGPIRAGPELGLG